MELTKRRVRWRDPFDRCSLHCRRSAPLQLRNEQQPIDTTASGGNLGPVFLGIDWAVFSLSTIIVALRLYTRVFITRHFWLDDAAIALTQVMMPYSLCHQCALIN